MLTTQNILIIIGIVLIVLLVVLFLFTLSLRVKLNRLTRRYRYFMQGTDGKSLELKLDTEVKELREIFASSQNMLHQQELLATMQLSSFQKKGLVLYDAFGDTGDKLSFSLTLLDGNNNGVLLSSLAGRDTSRLYAKEISNGECREPISSEEAESINRALNTVMPNMSNETKEAVRQAEEEKTKEETAEKKQKFYRIDISKKTNQKPQA